jgi:hypothetical protein
MPAAARSAVVIGMDPHKRSATIDGNPLKP